MAVEFSLRVNSKSAERDLRRFVKRAGSEIDRLKKTSVASSAAMRIALLAYPGVRQPSTHKKITWELEVVIQ